MNKKIKTEIIYYTGYTLHIFLNQFENLLNEYEHCKKNDSINDKTIEEPIKKNDIEVLHNLIRITNNFLNSKPYELKTFYNNILFS